MKKVLVVYHSQQYGNTGACAHLVAQGLEAEGLEVALINTNEAQRVDMAQLAACDGVAIGSPDYYSYVAGTIKQFFDDFLMAKRAGLSVTGKPCVLFLTHGGGGRALEPFRKLAGEFRLVAEPFTCRGKPEDGCVEAIALGRKLAQAVLG